MTLQISETLYQALIELFEKEKNKIFQMITDKYGKKYNFKLADLDKYKVKIRYRPTPKYSDKVIPPDKERCQARTWSEGFLEPKKDVKYENESIRISKGGYNFGDRCKRKKIKGKDFCKQHSKNLCHGRYDSPPNKLIQGFYYKYSLDPDESDDDSLFGESDESGESDYSD